MFFTSKQREEIYAKFYEQELLILKLKERVSRLENIAHPDTPPKRKPGRPRKETAQ